MNALIVVEAHQMMAGTVAALLQAGSSSKETELKSYCERLIVRLQDPHFRIMLAYIVLNKDWTEVLNEEALPLRERIAIALRFLDDKELSSYLRRVTDACRSNGSIEGLALTGLTPRGLDILQSYVDNTGDIQTAALLASLVCPGRYQDIRAERWADAYRELLNGWKLFHHRCQFDIDRGRLLKEGIQNGDFAPREWVKRQFLIRCNYCNKIMNSPKAQQGQDSIAVMRRKVRSRQLKAPFISPRLIVNGITVGLVSLVWQVSTALCSVSDEHYDYTRRWTANGPSTLVFPW